MNNKLSLRVLLVVASTASVAFAKPTMLASTSLVQSIASKQNSAATTSRVSASSNGTEGNGNSMRPAISKDGRYVVFESYATNLVADDTNDQCDVFVHDLQTGQTSRISVATDGTQGNGISCHSRPSISGNGRYVGFASGSNNLVDNDTNNAADIFIRDRLSGQTKRVSVSSGGAQANYGALYPFVSEDGRYITFGSNSPNLVDGSGGVYNIYLHDQETGQTTLISRGLDGVPSNHNSYYSSISADGRFVAFNSYASNLVLSDTNRSDIFIHDRQSTQTSVISVASDGTQANGDCLGHDQDPLISANGRFVIFDCIADNLVSGAYGLNVYLRDLQTNQTSIVSVSSDGTRGNGRASLPAISHDARYVTFAASASDLVADDTNNTTDVFRHDRLTGQTSLASIACNGSLSNGASNYSAISNSGSIIAFDSEARNLVDNDTNNVTDVFVHNLDIDGSCPQQPVKRPVIFIPGTGSSFNWECFWSQLSCNDPDKWGWTKTVKGYYQHFITQLERVEYSETTDPPYFSVFHYDWRKSFASNVYRLKEHINKVITSTHATQVDLVGHSQGGMVARAYVQSGVYANDVAHLVTVGSPHEGLPRMYPYWEGGVLYRLDNPAAYRFMLALCECGGDSLELQKQFPGFNDLLPTYDYVYDTSNRLTPKSESQLVLRNFNLALMNKNIQTLFDRTLVTTIAGYGQLTPIKMIVQDKSFDQQQKHPLNWPDGEWLGEQHENEWLNNGGDATIPYNSAILRSPAHVVTIDSKAENVQHHELLNNKKVVEEVLKALDISLPTQTSASFHHYSVKEEVEDQPTLLILVGSAQITVT